MSVLKVTKIVLQLGGICGKLHKDSGAVEPGSFAGRGKLACWKAFQAEEDAVYCTCGYEDDCAGYIKSCCCD